MSSDSSSSSSSSSTSWALRLQQIEELSKAWKQINLRAQLQGPIEADSARTAVERENLAANRKSLMQTTKDYSKIEDQNEKLTKLGPLIKAYQLHVDESNKCLKSVESARLSLYEFVKQMDDPVPVLEKLLRATQNELLNLSSENSNQNQQGLSSQQQQQQLQQHQQDKTKIATLEEKLQDLIEEMSELKNQEVTISKLREQVAEMELDAAHEKQQVATEMSNEVQEVLKSWQQREHTLRQENGTLMSENRKLQKLYNDVSLHFSGVKQQLEHLLTQRENDAEKNADELQEVQIQLAVAKRENQILQENVTSLKEKIAEFEMQLLDGENNNNSLLFGSSSASPARGIRDGNLSTTTPQHQIFAAASSGSSQPRQDGEVPCSEKKILLELTEKISQVEKQRLDENQKSSETISRLEHNLKEMRDWGSEVNLQFERLKDAYDVSKQENSTLRRKLDVAVEEAREMRRQVIDLEGTISSLQSSGNRKSKSAQEDENIDASTNVENRDDDGGITIITIPSSSNDQAQHQQQKSSSSTTTLEAVVAQRENLKRRLLNLEDASSRELNLLRQELAGMKGERQTLLVEIAKLNGSLPPLNSMNRNSSNNNHNNNHTPVAAVSNTGGPPPNPLDLFGNLLAKFVNANMTTRRILVIYLLSLHLFFFLMLALDT